MHPVGAGTPGAENTPQAGGENHNQDTAVTSAGTNGEQNGGKPATSTTGQDAAQSNGPKVLPVAQPGNDASSQGHDTPQADAGTHNTEGQPAVTTGEQAGGKPAATKPEGASAELRQRLIMLMKITLNLHRKQEVLQQHKLDK